MSKLTFAKKIVNLTASIVVIGFVGACGALIILIGHDFFQAWGLIGLLCYLFVLSWSCLFFWAREEIGRQGKD
jgi:hypothetical protein